MKPTRSLYIVIQTKPPHVPGSTLKSRYDLLFCLCDGGDDHDTYCTHKPVFGGLSAICSVFVYLLVQQRMKGTGQLLSDSKRGLQIPPLSLGMQMMQTSMVEGCLSASSVPLHPLNSTLMKDTLELVNEELPHSDHSRKSVSFLVNEEVSK